MPIANVTLTHTFDEWRAITNQLVVESSQTNSLAVAAFNAANNTVSASANLTANLILGNSATMNIIVSYVVTNGNVANQVMANTQITEQIYNNANTVAASFFGNTVIALPQANTARDHANAAFGQANTARDLANTGGGALTIANAAFLQANTGRSHANVSFAQGNAAFGMANTARDHANVAFGGANTARDHANASFGQANTTRIHANAGFGQANTARDHANAAFAKANNANAQIPIYNDDIDDEYYVVFVNTSSGNVSTLNVSSTGLTFNPSSGTLGATVFNSLSDEAKKTNIRLISDPVIKINTLRGVQFDFIDTGNPSAGIIAQDVIKIMPELVANNMSVNYSGIIGLLVEAVKELSKRIDDLENK